MGKPEFKRQLGRPTRRWENKSSRISVGVMDWVNLAHDRERRRDVVNAIMNFRIP